jgi:hypothetical protein
MKKLLLSDLKVNVCSGVHVNTTEATRYCVQAKNHCCAAASASIHYNIFSKLELGKALTFL